MVMLLFGAAAIAASPPLSFCSQPGWNVIWRDDFERLDRSSWNVAHGIAPLARSSDVAPLSSGADCHGAGCILLGSCREAACTADSVQVQNGQLLLKSQRRHFAGRNFTTGAVNTFGKVSWRANDHDGPFRMCIAAQLPGVPGRAAGLWPAHWLMPADDSCDPDEGEMDIMEMVGGDGIAYATYHWQTSYPKEKCAFPKSHSHVFSQMQLADGWNSSMHEWSVERGPRSIAFALDGKEVLRSSQPIFWDVPWYLILNTAIGGGWPGSPTEETAFPVYHAIDYVHVARPAHHQPKQA